MIRISYQYSDLTTNLLFLLCHTRQTSNTYNNNLLYNNKQNSGAAGAWGRGAPVSKPNNSSSSTNGERPKLNLSKKTEPKDKENNTASPKQTKVEETKKPVEKRGWEVKATKSTESATESKKDIEEKKEENEPASTAAAVRSFAAMAAKPAAPPPVVDKPVQSEPEKKKKEDSPTKKKEKDDKKDNTNAESSNNNKDAGEKKHRRDRRGERSKPREPMVMNSRAAMLGDADAPKKEVSEGYVYLFVHY